MSRDTHRFSHEIISLNLKMETQLNRYEKNGDEQLSEVQRRSLRHAGADAEFILIC